MNIKYISPVQLDRFTKGFSGQALDIVRRTMERTAGKLDTLIKKKYMENVAVRYKNGVFHIQFPYENCSVVSPQLVTLCFHQCFEKELQTTSFLPEAASMRNICEEANRKGLIFEWADYLESFSFQHYQHRIHPITGTDFPIIVTAWNIIADYVKEHNIKIGIHYMSPYNMVVVDLVQEANGFLHPYERIVQTKRGKSVAILPICNGKFVLLDQFRHAIQDRQLCIPRGFGSGGHSSKDDAIREIKEEIGAEGITSVNQIGTITPDSGLTATKVDVFCIQIKAYNPQNNYEGIRKLVTLDEAELAKAIGSGQITDSFTLAAYALWKNAKGQQ